MKDIKKLAQEAYLKYYYDVPYEGMTSQGKPLRKLQNITCPYRGIKIIPAAAVKEFERQLKKCRTAEESIELLLKYKKHLLPCEKAMLAIFQEFAHLNPCSKFENCLQMIAQSSLMKLKLEELEVIDEVDRMSRKLSVHTALKLREKTAKCRQIILGSSKRDIFKRKVFLSSLDEIEPERNEREIMHNIKNKALFLPSSESSKNAFIVKYSKRKHQEITRRIFIASTGSIEHITPASCGGLNTIGNFILCCANGNRARENMNLTEYVKRFPKIPAFCQLYIDDIIEVIHNGGLKGNETYPYKIKEKLKKESEGRIMISLSEYKYTKEEAALAADEYEKRFENFKKRG